MTEIVKSAVDAGVAACVVPHAPPHRDRLCRSGPQVGEEQVAGEGGGGSDTGGSTDTTAPVVKITTPAVPATFTQGASISFTGMATDNIDGDISGLITWSSNRDGALGTGAKVDTTTLTVGEHVVTAAATDVAKNVGTAAVTATVEAPADPPPSTGISLLVVAYEVKGIQHADLTWSGANALKVDVFGNGKPNIIGTENDGAYTDSTGSKGGGSVTFQVCQTGTTTCSAPVTAVW